MACILGCILLNFNIIGDFQLSYHSQVLFIPFHVFYCSSFQHIQATLLSYLLQLVKVSLCKLEKKYYVLLKLVHLREGPNDLRAEVRG